MNKEHVTYKVAENLMKTLPNIGRFMSHYLNKEGDDDITMMQMGVLFQIQAQPMTASDLAKKRRVSLQSMSVLIQNMVERGWVIRSRNTEDRRQFLLQITPAGSELAQTTKEQMVSYLAQLLESFSPEEMASAEQFLSALQRVLHQQVENC